MHTMNQDHMMYVSWDINVFCHYRPFFTFDSANNRKNQDFEKIKISSGDIINLHLCTTNDDHMMYGSWDIKCDRHNFLSSSAIFCSFATPPKNPKNEDIKEMKTPGDTIDIFHFGQFFALLPP